MNVEQFLNEVSTDLFFNQKLHKLIYNKEVHQAMEKKINEQFQYGIEVIPEKDYLNYVEMLSDLADDPFCELKELFQSRLKERIYHSIDLGEDAHLLENALKTMIKEGDVLTDDWFKIEFTPFEEFIRAVLVSYYYFLVEENQRYLNQNTDEFKNILRVNINGSFLHMSLSDSSKSIYFSFDKKYHQYDDPFSLIRFRQMGYENDSENAIMPKRREIYGAIMLAQSMGIELQENVELVERPHVKKFAKINKELSFDVLKKYIDFVAWVIKEYQYSDEVTSLAEQE